MLTICVAREGILHFLQAIWSCGGVSEMVSGRIKVRIGFCVMVIRKLSPEQKDLS